MAGLTEQQLAQILASDSEQTKEIAHAMARELMSKRSDASNLELEAWRRIGNGLRQQDPVKAHALTGALQCAHCGQLYTSLVHPNTITTLTIGEITQKHLASCYPYRSILSLLGMGA